MKKIVSNVFFGSTIVSAVALAVFCAFCIYDLTYLPTTVFADSMDFWVAMRDYIPYLSIPSIIGMVTSGLHFLLSPESRLNASKVLLFVFFIVALVAAAFLYYYTHNF